MDHQILLDVDLTVQEFWIFLEFCDVWFLISFPRNQLLITIGPTSFLVDCNSQFGVVHQLVVAPDQPLQKYPKNPEMFLDHEILHPIRSSGPYFLFQFPFRSTSQLTRPLIRGLSASVYFQAICQSYAPVNVVLLGQVSCCYKT